MSPNLFAVIKHNINKIFKIIGAAAAAANLLWEFNIADKKDARQINSKKGVGAKLLPVLKFTKVDDAKRNVEITQGVTQDAVVTVISCIQK